ncbi:hypothetical protein ACF3VQ_12610 [Yersinia sp. HM-2024]|uniref:hypothetical protein n=1 Tax=Yersinia sp. HM-2024 TaxID=3344550 RepID=UPI00370DD696
MDTFILVFTLAILLAIGVPSALVRLQVQYGLIYLWKRLWFKVKAILTPPSHNSGIYSLATGGTVSIAALFIAGQQLYPCGYPESLAFIPANPSAHHLT